MLGLHSYFIYIDPKQRPHELTAADHLAPGGLQSYPGQEGYRRCEIYKAGDRVPSPTEGVAELDVAELLQGL